jgi:hypothetical protein
LSGAAMISCSSIASESTDCGRIRKFMFPPLMLRTDNQGMLASWSKLS